MSRGTNMGRCIECGKQFVCGDCITDECHECENLRKKAVAGNRLIRMMALSNSVKALTNEQLSDRVLNELWQHTSIETPEHVLLSEVIERLRNLKG